jgi:hypothetical protein
LGDRRASTFSAPRGAVPLARRRRAKKTKAVAAFAALLVLSARPARAETKLELGVRAGYALPFGEIYDPSAGELASTDVTIGQVPLWFDIGARMGPHAYAGGYLQYGVGLLSDELSAYCDELDLAFAAQGGGADCRVHDLRVGANFQWHFGGLGAPLDPWVGGGFGHEWLSIGAFAHRGDLRGDAAVTLRGFEFVNLQAGLDLPATDTMSVGPFLAFTTGAYASVLRSCGGNLCKYDERRETVADQELHHWLFFGIRAAFVH